MSKLPFTREGDFDERVYWRVSNDFPSRGFELLLSAPEGAAAYQVLSRQRPDLVDQARLFGEAIIAACNELQEVEDRPGGELFVGSDGAGMVVVNLDRDRTGHLIFTPEQAREFARILTAKAAIAEQEAPQGVPS